MSHGPRLDALQIFVRKLRPCCIPSLLATFTPSAPDCITQFPAARRQANRSESNPSDRGETLKRAQNLELLSLRVEVLEDCQRQECTILIVLLMPGGLVEAGARLRRLVRLRLRRR